MGQKKNIRARKEKAEKEYSKNTLSIQTPSVSQILNDDQEKWKAQKIMNSCKDELNMKNKNFSDNIDFLS